MTCPGCHADNLADASTCERCGHSLTPSLEDRWPERQSWSLEATVVTSRHETYRNTFTLQSGQ